jgi:dihydrofolate reductase
MTGSRVLRSGTHVIDLQEDSVRKVVLAMMATMNGRLDDPDAWVAGVSEDHYQEIVRGYSTFDTVLVGRVTYGEMYEFWPTAGDAEDAGESQRAMAEMMNSYQKYVFSTAPEQKLEWNNSEPARVTTDDELRRFVDELKSQPGKDIHLSGGAKLAQSMVRLGLVDEYRFFTFPVVSAGACWYDRLDGPLSLELLSATPFSNGAVGLNYRPTAVATP